MSEAKAIGSEERQVYFASDIQKILGIGRSKCYYFLSEVYQSDAPIFRVIKVGKLFRVPKDSFNAWINGE